MSTYEKKKYRQSTALTNIVYDLKNRTTDDYLKGTAYYFQLQV